MTKPWVDEAIREIKAEYDRLQVMTEAERRAYIFRRDIRRGYEIVKAKQKARRVREG